MAGIRRRRRTASVRAGLAAAGAAAAVAATGGAVLATASGGVQPGGAARPQAVPASAARPATRVRLDGYVVSLPAGPHVHKIASGYLVQNRGATFTIFLETGPDIGPGSVKARGSARRVQAGMMTGWWLGDSRGGELWLRQPGLPARVFLVAKVRGATQRQALDFAATLDVTAMPAVHVPATGG